MRNIVVSKHKAPLCSIASSLENWRQTEDQLQRWKWGQGGLLSSSSSPSYYYFPSSPLQICLLSPSVLTSVLSLSQTESGQSSGKWVIMMSKRGCGCECLAKLAHVVRVRIFLQELLGTAFVTMNGIFRKVQLFKKKKKEKKLFCQKWEILQFYVWCLCTLWWFALLCVLPSSNFIISMLMFTESPCCLWVTAAALSGLLGFTSDVSNDWTSPLVCVCVVLLTSGEWFLQLTRDWCDLLSVLNSTQDRCRCLGLTGSHVCFACFYLLILWVMCEWEAQRIHGDVLRSSPIGFEWCLHNIFKMENGTQTEE